MKFIRITPQLAVNADKIVSIGVAGFEDPDKSQEMHVMVLLFLQDVEESVIYRQVKTFREAEAVLANLVSFLEAD